MPGHSESQPIIAAAAKTSRVRKKRLIHRHRCATALAGGILALAIAAPAAAQQTRGGAGGGSPPSAGGASVSTGIGSNGGTATVGFAGGGGGGAGATGGSGGSGARQNGSLGAAGGAGGPTPGASGGDGTDDLGGGPAGGGGGGGGGGAHGRVSGTADAIVAFGGDGGAGGDAFSGDGGGGGAGGYGYVYTGTGPATFSNPITGGQGGQGGTGFYGGTGGGGGHGLVFINGVSATINASVFGGQGGARGLGNVDASLSGFAGAGGYGIVGSNLDLTLNSFVTGGLSGDTTSRGAALYFGSGTNRVTLGSSGTVTGGTVIASGTLEFNTPSDHFLGSVISGGGSIIKTGAGTLTLTGANSYAGGTTINAGLINFANGGNLGTGSITLDGGGLQWATGNTLDISSRLSAIGSAGGTFDTNGNNVTLASILSGTGGITKTGSGILTLTGNNSYTGTTTISGGTLQIGSGGVTGTLGNGNVTNNASLVFNRSDTHVVANAISGTGSLTQAGTGATILTGANSYSGGTALNAGTIEVGAAGALGTGRVTLNGGSLRSSLDVTIANEIRWLGNQSSSIISAATGTTLTLTSRFDAANVGIPTYLRFGSAGDSGTIILDPATSIGSAVDAAGELSVEGGTLRAGSSLIGRVALSFLMDNFAVTRISAGATLDLTGSQFAFGDSIRSLQGGGILTNDGTTRIDAGSFAGTIMGTGGIEKMDSGTLILTGTNTYSGATTISDGTLQIGDGGTTGTLGSGAVVNDASLVFNRSDTHSVANAISGTGSLTQAGTGTTILTGTNTYSGTTYIDAGTLQIGDGGTDGTLGTGNVINDGALVFNRSDDLTVGNDIDGTGSLTKLGTGTLTLTGLNSYSGTTSILGGTLAASYDTLGFSQLVEIGNGAQLRALDDLYLGDMRILAGGGTIDTGGSFVEVVGGIDFTFGLTKIGSGTLLISDDYGIGTGAGGINVNAGTLALGSDTAAGTGTISLADSTILQNFSCFCGTLALDNRIEVAAGGTATLDGNGYDMVLNGPISGGNVRFSTDTGSFIEPLASIFTLNGANSYGDTIIGPNVAVILEDGTLGNGNVIFDSAPSHPFFPSALVFANSADYTFGGSIIGDGIVSVETFDPTTTITLAGSSSAAANFTGTILLSSGNLAIDGAFGDVIDNDATLIFLGFCQCEEGGGGGEGTLSGSGTFHGNVDAFLGGTISPGNSPGTLTIGGDLILGSATVLNYELGEPGVVGGPNNDHVIVGGNLTLDGTVNVTGFGPNYGPGYYRLITYGGDLTDEGLDPGTIDGGFSATVLTNINGQVNLLLGNGVAPIIQYWDGDDMGAGAEPTGRGGNGTWNSLSTSTNWTIPPGYAINDVWQSRIGVFAGAAGGTVTVQGTQAFQELRFQTDGYLLLPDDPSARLATTGGFSVLDVSAGVTADIGVVIEGLGGLTKTGTGTLILSGVNTFTGPATVSEGILRAGIDFTFGTGTDLDVAAAGTFDLNGWRLDIDSLTGGGNVLLGTNGQLAIGSSGGDSLFSGSISGTGLVRNQGGTFTLSGSVGASTFTAAGGAVNVTSVGSITADVVQNFATFTNGGTVTALAVQNFGSFTNNGTIAGVTQNFASFTNTGTMGALTNLGGNASNGGTINGAVANFADFASTGIINGTLVNSVSSLLQGQLNGDISNQSPGATVTLTGTLTGVGVYSGVNGSTFDLASFNTTVGAIRGGGSIQLGSAALTVGGANSNELFGGTISGSGSLTKTGTGTLTLSGTSDYTGGTSLLSGTLRLLGSNAAGTGAITATGSTISYGNGIVLGNAIPLQLGPTGTRLEVSDGDTATQAGAISSAGVNRPLEKVGIGTLILTGANTHTGLTLVSEGTLVLAAGGSLAGAVQNETNFTNAGTVGGLVVNNGALTSTGVLNGGLTNFGSTSLSGEVNGDVGNAGLITLTGSTTGIGVYGGQATSIFRLGGFNTTIGGVTGSGSIQLGTASLTIGGNNGPSSFAGVISGAGGLIKTGSGMLLLTGVNTYTGLTTISGGTLGLTGSLAGPVLNNAALINQGTISGLVTNNASLISTGTLAGGLDNSGTATIQGQLNGPVANLSGATITLSGATTGTGRVTQSSGAIFDLNGFNAAFGSLGGDGEVRLGTGTLTVGSDDSDSDFAGIVTGSGAVGLVKVGTGTLTLSGANIYTGLTSVSDGALVVTAGGSLAGNVENDATFSNAGIVGGALINRASATNSGTISQGVANSGTFTTTGIIGVGLENGAGATVSARGQINGFVANSGTFNLTGPLTGITTLTQTNSGIFNLGGHDLAVGALAGAGLVNLGTGGADLTVGGSNASTLFSGIISGDGSLVKVGTGTLVLTGASTYSGGTLISGGALQVGNGGTTGSIAGPIVNNAVLILNRSDALALASAMSGTGMLVQAGTGTTTLTGANNYSGGTIIQSGRLRGSVNSIQGDIQNNSELELVEGTLGTFSGRLFGTGLLEKSGAGQLILTGDNSGFTGATRVLGGELTVQGLLSRSRVTIASGATVSGTGVVGGILAQSGGNVSPGGTAVGMLGVNGNVQFLSGSSFIVQVGAAGSDLLLSNGTAQLGGTLALTNSGGNYQFNSIYVLLQAAGGRTGTFDITAGLGGFGNMFAPRIVYTDTQVQLLMAPNRLLNILGNVAGTPNQINTLRRIDEAVVAGFDPQPLFALFGLAPAPMLAAADALSAEIYPTASRIALDDERLVREAAIGRLRATQEGQVPGLGAWGQSFGSWGSGDGDGNAAAYDREQLGFLVGVDGGGAWDGGAFRAGVTGFHVTTDVRVDARASSAEIERIGGGIYVGLELGNFRARIGGTYAALSLDARRTAAFAGFGDSLVGQTDGQAIQGFGEIAYRMNVGARSFVEPFLLASIARVTFDEFAETGGVSRVQVAEQENSLTTVTAGLRGETVLDLGGRSRIRLGGAIGARHVSGDRMISSPIALDLAPGQAFPILSAAIDRFSIVGNLDATADLSEALSLTVGYSGVTGANARDHAVRGTVTLRF